MSWERQGDTWVHRPWWKAIINTALRWLQEGRSPCWLVYTRTTESGDPPSVLGYGFGRITMRWDL
jgi:hypothetical protein